MTTPSCRQLNESLLSADWPYFNELSVEPVEDQSIDKQVINYHLTITPELSYLAGHFPQQPIVPGVVQVHWAGELAKQFFACDGFSTLKKVKFSNPILPKQSLRLSLSFQKSAKQVNFAYSDDQQPYSSGVIVFQ